ncbi:hypothetical protein [Mycobacterium vicinigordonae]|uniref:Uncharacterized protein n=1 Tax=Mycobacterium vicinigordonae TaxID=1719132 RepID=A0A7D6E7S4_9MYCO|nr:hypothetical protein [Mycobacterium vicinigordonae]QLL08703.1 hypothetical protein H0P51_07230 [Mycobacterium vicinigordonae]
MDLISLPDELLLTAAGYLTHSVVHEVAPIGPNGFMRPIRHERDTQRVDTASTDAILSPYEYAVRSPERNFP